MVPNGKVLTTFAPQFVDSMTNKRGKGPKGEKNKSRANELKSSASKRYSKGKRLDKDKFLKRGRKGEPQPKPDKEKKEGVRLNKYLANAGICSRREADTLIEAGAVEINGEVVTKLGTRVKPTDDVKCGGSKVNREKPVYVLLNKPKDFITTVSDPQGRKTVMDIVGKACKERIYPVGRLDRNTTGVLLFTNDGDLAKKLTHPKHQVRKIYHVTTDQPMSNNDLVQLCKGVKLEDGTVQADKAAFVEGKEDRREIGVELHSGKNRVIRRMFEALEYKVVKLDRVSFAGLTKKNIPRGHYRFLNEKEVSFLRML